MKTIYVERPFLLKLDNGAQRHFGAGEHNVEDAIAAHWYVQAHCIPKPVATPEPVTLPDASEGAQTQMKISEAAAVNAEAKSDAAQTEQKKSAPELTRLKPKKPNRDA